MRSNCLVVFSCSIAALALGPAISHAQRGGPGPGGPGPENRIGFLGFAGGKVVTGAPFCGQLTDNFVQKFADGNQIHRQTVTNVCRDSQGRTYRQVDLPSVVSGSGDSPRAIMISDPVAGMDYMLDPVHKTYRKFAAPSHKPAGDNPPRFQGGNPNPSATTDLGFQTINGLSCKGTRFTRTIPARSPLGNEQALTVTTERWYSPDLSIDIQTQTTDPSRGNTSTAMNNITRTEPDASLFQVPAGYTLQQGFGGPGGFGRRPRAQGNTQ